MNRKLLKRQLEKMNHIVIEAENGQKSVDIIKT